MINWKKTIHKQRVLCLLLVSLLIFSACGKENEAFQRMEKLIDRNTTFEKVEYFGIYTILNVACYKDKLYFTTQESGEGICEMALGDSYTDRLLCTFSENEYGTVIATDVYGNVYTVVSEKDENNNTTASSLWKITSEGEVVYQTDFFSQIEGMSPTGIGADKDGYAYVVMKGVSQCSILIFSESGEYSGKIELDTKSYSLLDAIGRCADGYVYVALADKEKGDDDEWGGAIARLDGKNHLLTIQDVSNVVSDRGSFGCIGSTSADDFVIFGPTYDDIYGGNCNDEIMVLSTKISSDIPEGLLGAKCIVLDDGRILSVKNRFGGMDEDGNTIYKKEGIEFYYIPIGDN